MDCGNTECLEREAVSAKLREKVEKWMHMKYSQLR
jgi:hypothetical protein